MLQLSSTAQVVDALRRSRTVEAQVYTIRGKVLQALEDAARRGAHVEVRLEAEPASDSKGALTRRNHALVAQMRAAGIDATLQSHVHAKRIDVDGTVFLDEKNFDGNADLVLRDDDANDPAIASCKSGALAGEAALLNGASRGDAVIVESETFGVTAVSSALRALARNGESPRLLVCQRTLSGNAHERAELESLAAAGVQVRVCKDSAKLAVAGERAWLGSANATSAWGQFDMTDWGACTSDAAITAAVRERLEDTWAAARPL